MKQGYNYQKNPRHVSMTTRLRLFTQICLFVVTGLVYFNANAVDYTLPADIGIGPFANCSGTGPYTCAGKVEIKFPDTVTLTASVTLNVTAEFKVDDFGGPVNAAGIYTMNVFANKGHIDGDEIVNINLTASGDITLHKSATVIGDVTSTGGTLNIDPDSTVDGTCDPVHPQCNGGGGGPGPGLSCTIEKIAANGEEFKAISGNSDSNVIAVGKNGSIYNYDGANWSQNAFSAGEELRDIEVIASGEAWAVGKQGKVVQFDGTVWNTLPAPTGQDLRGVWAISNTEVWVVGKTNSLYLWNGLNWSNMSGAGQANVDNNQELRGAWGNPTYFYAAEKDGDLYRYTRTGGPWAAKITSCNALGDMDIERMWGDGMGNVYLAGKDKMGGGGGDDQATLLRYNEATMACVVENTTITAKKFNGVAGNGGIIYTVGKKEAGGQGLVVENTTASWIENTEGTQEIKDVWVSSSNTAYYAAKGGFVSICTDSIAATLDHFTVTPATSSASTCLTNAITIEAINAYGDPVVDFTSLISTSVSRNHGNWSKNSALGVLAPDPDTDDNGVVDYTFVIADASSIILDLGNTHAETVTVTVTDGTESATSVPIQFSENVFIITEDPIQVAGRPQAMSIAMWKNDPGTGFCGIDTNYNSATQSLETSVTRTAALPVANAPLIGPVGIPDAPAANAVVLDFSVTPGQASFDLLTTDVGQYRLNFVDTPDATSHSDVNIIGVSTELTVRPFGLAVTNITGLIPNPGNTGSGGAVFALAGTDFSATVEAVLWDSNDDTNNDGVLDTGIYADNIKAPSYAWDTTLGVPSPAMGFTPTAVQNGVQGSFINGAIALADFTTGTASPTSLQYDEVGSFTLQSSATDYLGTASADLVGDDIVVGRFRPASFNIAISQHGMFASSCVIYTYIGESFSYDVLHPSFLVTAMNGLATPATNYTGPWAKLDDNSVTFTMPTADITQDGSDGSTKMVISYTQDVDKFTITDNTNGSFTFEFEDDQYVYNKNSNSEIENFNSDIDLLVTDVTDTETVTTSSNITLQPSFIDMRFGRVKMTNTHGSELSPLAMPMIVEYLDSPGLYTINGDDNCTTIATAQLALADNLSTPGSSTVTVTNPTAVGGILGVTLTAPGTGITGYIDVTPDLTASVDSWLRYDWTVGAGAFTENPTGRATFGIYTGNDVNIYKSQTYQ